MSIEQFLRELSQVSSHQFPDSSAKWLLRQREHLEALLEMLLGSLVEAFDFERVEQLNRSFISDEFRTQESDMVFSLPFRAPTQTCEEVIVYLLIEHQSTVDRSMGLRVLSYMVQIWMEERRHLYIFLLILHRRPAAERQDLFRILIEENTQNMEIVEMAESIIEISEKRGHQQGRQEGIEEGARRTSIESTLAILNRRFPDTDADTLKPALEAIADIKRLKQLNLEASFIETFHAFREQVDA